MADNSIKTVCGTFSTREGAERAVEHLVQEHGINRADVFVRALGRENSAGTDVSGADIGGHEEEAALEGPIEVSADVSETQRGDAERTLRRIGAQNVITR